MQSLLVLSQMAENYDIFFVSTTSGVISDDKLEEPEKVIIIGIKLMSYSCYRICGLAYSTMS